MQVIEVLPNQSLIDIIIRYCGTLESAAAICDYNNLPLSATTYNNEIMVGNKIVIPNGATTKTNVLNDFAKDKTVIATVGGTYCTVPASITIYDIIGDQATALVITGPGSVIQWGRSTVDAIPTDKYNIIGNNDHLHSDSLGRSYIRLGTIGIDGSLSPSTTYYFYVRTQCASDVFSAWKKTSFTTTV